MAYGSGTGETHIMNTKKKPLGRKNYGSIPHLPNSRMGPGDHKCHEGQERIATTKARDKHDEIIVQEKLDGSNVGVARIGHTIYPLGRAGYTAASSPFLQHRLFSNWAYENTERFMAVLKDGERLVGEWLAQAHGTIYELRSEPLVVFDLMVGKDRMTYDNFLSRAVLGGFVTPHLIHRGDPISVGLAMELLGEHGHHGAVDQVEGVVYRVERNKLVDRHSGNRKRIVDFLVKWVRPNKKDGIYLESVSGGEPVWNWKG